MCVWGGLELTPPSSVLFAREGPAYTGTTQEQGTKAEQGLSLPSTGLQGINWFSMVLDFLIWEIENICSVLCKSAILQMC